MEQTENPEGTAILGQAASAGDESSGGELSCPYCSATIPAGEKYCPDCGFERGSMSAEPVAVEGAEGGVLELVADEERFVLAEGEHVLGRTEGDIKIANPYLSRSHMKLRIEGGRLFVTDLGSTNGTRLNGALLGEPRRLNDTDQIQLGNTVIKFMLVDETEAKYLRRIAQIARTDSLTGLSAKHRFDALLEVAVQDATARGVALSLLMADMDNLKGINDRHGHQTGAGTIQQVGRIIGELVGNRGEAARFGGDEFCAYLVGADLAAARALAEQIRLRVDQTTFDVEHNAIRTSISIGVAQMTTETRTGQQVLTLADQALYRAKARGRNCVAD